MQNLDTSATRARMRAAEKRVTQLHYQRHAPVYNPRWRNPRVEHWLQERLPQGNGQVAVDLGCGNGRYSQLILEAGWRVIGLDLSPEMLVALGRYLPQVYTLRGDVECQPITNARCQLVTAMSVLGEYAPLIPAVQEVFRILRPGGRFLFTAIRLDRWDVLARQCLNRLVGLIWGVNETTYERLGSPTVRRFPCHAGQVHHSCEQAGFIDCHLFAVGTHYLVECSKPIVSEPGNTF